MKSLEELGISPAPWTVADDDGLTAYIYDGNQSELTQSCYTSEDARLIAAAPELYEALRVLVNIQYEGAKEDMLIPAAWQYARIALAKAGGTK